MAAHLATWTREITRKMAATINRSAKGAMNHHSHRKAVQRKFATGCAESSPGNAT